MTKIKELLTKHRLGLGSIGIIISLFYSALAFFMLHPIENISNIFNLNLDSLSKLGSFLSGVFTPLAFVWLLYGYKQQNIIIQHQIDTYNTDKFNEAQPVFEVLKIDIIRKKYEGYNENPIVLEVNFKIYKNDIWDFGFHPIGSNHFNEKASSTVPFILEEKSIRLDTPLVYENSELLEAKEISKKESLIIQIPVSFIDKIGNEVKTFLNVYKSLAPDNYWGQFERSNKIERP